MAVTVPHKKRAPRIAGIGAAAAALGVTRQHLRLVIIGERESKPLLARYRTAHNPKLETTKP